jgi:hypothetical protein
MPTDTLLFELQMDKSFRPAQPDHPGIPLSRLARQDEPILFFDEVTLFEDELHDNGVANLTVRIVSFPSLPHHGLPWTPHPCAQSANLPNCLA